MHTLQPPKLHKSHHTHENNNMKPYGNKDSQIRIVSWSCERKGHNNEIMEINPENKLGKKCESLKVWKFVYYQLAGKFFPQKVLMERC